MSAHRSNSTRFAALIACVATLTAARVDAQTLIFSEDWESGTARWRAVTSVPVTLATDVACSTTFQREVIPYSGGRVFITVPVPVTAGRRYCMTVWIRGIGSACNTQPFIGINGQWLIGHRGFGTPYIAGGTVVPVNSNGAWNWYSAAFTADSSSLSIMDEIFSAGGAGSADFDDIRVYEGACPTSPTGAPHDCPLTTQMCPCAASSDCSPSAPVCTVSTTRCGPCARDADCAGRPGAAACDTTSGACVTCTATNAAACAGATPVCNATTNDCVQCTATSSSACTGATPVCAPTTGTCVGCVTASDCGAAAPVCTAGVCARCTTDASCAGRPTTPACNPATGACVACVTSAGCGAATPVCDSTTSVCERCTSDAQCAGRAGAAACDTGTGGCVQCTSGNASACGATAPVCGAGGVCVLCTAGMGGAAACASNPDGRACATDSMGRPFCGCATDADCGATSSGRVCDATTRRCIDGCSPAPGRNGCPAERFCSSDDATGARTGVCTMTCNFDEDCARGMPEAPRCLPASDAGPSRCVACRGDADCAGRMDGRSVCSTESLACVQCTPTSSSACSAEGAGAMCLSGGACGCATDTDCGGASSGRVCDATTRACLAGCRASGGNGCPTGTECSAMGGAVGMCVAAVDASVPDVVVDAEVSDIAVVVDASVDVAVQDLPAPPDAFVQDVSGLDVGTGDASVSVTARDDGGCGCGVPGGRSSGAMQVVCALAALAVARRRRSA